MQELMEGKHLGDNQAQVKETVQKYYGEVIHFKTHPLSPVFMKS